MPSSLRFSSLCLLAIVVLAGAGLTACGNAGKQATSSASVPPTSTTTAGSAADRSGTVWLCRPGQANDPCLSDLTATAVDRNGATRIEHATPARDPRVDCFYVYPTISDQQSVNANLETDLRETEVAIAQASRFSQVCRVYSPVYRQITLSALDHPSRITLADALLAYRSVLSAFRDYLTYYNHGRGIVLIGHSQGAVILIKLLQQEVDGNPAMRHRLVSALLLGGNVTVARGKAVGGDFAHIPACRSASETGCVVAYSSFTSKPPVNSQFGRTSSDAGVGLLAPHNLSSTLQIMCVNPASPAGGAGSLHPYVPSLVLGFLPGAGRLSLSTPWASFPGEYVARCTSSGNATWLQVTHTPGHDRRPSITGLQEGILGLHILDVNIALGDLVRLVSSEANAYQHR